ncbi:energy transducer TonB family protein [Pseudaminobacter soli (ex Li et al. 2025)]|uniref:TonB C-terminal domain-containing protein n=1 Tax=Pseudaminobacter soli (ex Li et al. 2025) TaxID=1295366 RepID=A0A2P7SKI0_9HYPH|nr:energy transducer TonB [Mesorhizobium soli]PSJ63003.1 hypothetical protein C7I85_05430 [Mesorhizobium soli]
MTMAADHVGFEAHSSLPSRREVVGWLTAGLVVIAIHALAAGVYQSMQVPDESAAEVAAPMVVNLAPIPFVAPSEIESEVVPEQVAMHDVAAVDGTSTLADDVESTTIQQETSETLEEAPLERTEPIVEEPVTENLSTESVAEPVAEEAEMTEPETLETVTPEVAVPIPAPRPEVEPEQPRKVAEKPKTEPVNKKPKAKQAEKVAEQSKEKRLTPEAAPAPKSQVSTAQRISLEERWKSRVSAWINRHKPRSAGGNGELTVSFVIDSGGTVLRATIARSSGNDDLDQAAIKMVNRSSPVPAPPQEIARNRHTMSLPVAFSR